MKYMVSIFALGILVAVGGMLLHLIGLMAGLWGEGHLTYFIPFVGFGLICLVGLLDD